MERKILFEITYQYSIDGLGNRTYNSTIPVVANNSKDAMQKVEDRVDKGSNVNNKFVDFIQIKKLQTVFI